MRRQLGTSISRVALKRGVRALGVAAAVISAQVPSWVLAGTVCDYDFAGDRYSGPALTCVRATEKRMQNKAGDWVVIPPNTLPRTDKGLLVENAQTNLIRNSSGTGGAAGTPGTFPTNWSLSSPAGLSRTISFETRRGIAGVVVNVFGTPTAAGTVAFAFEGYSTMGATSGQLLTGSTFFQADNVAASFGCNIELTERDSGALQVATGTAAVPLNTSFQRPFYNRTLTNAATAFINLRFNITGVVANTPVNMTLFLGMPQVELWSPQQTTAGGPSSPIRTTNGPLARAGDVITTTLPTGITDMTMSAIALAPSYPIISANIAEMYQNNTQGENFYQFRYNSAGNNLIGISGNLVSQAAQFPAISAPTLGSRFAAAYAANAATGEQAVSLNASVPSTAGTLRTTDRSITVGLTTLQLGLSRISGGTRPWNSYIERFTLKGTYTTPANLNTAYPLAA